MSWISLEDQVGALHHLLMHRAARGVYNLTAPAPVTNDEFVHDAGPKYSSARP